MAQKELLIANGTVVSTGSDPVSFLYDAGVFIVGDTIKEVGPTSELKGKHPQAEYIDAHGMLIMPGLICAHGHFYGMYARGMGLKDEPPSGFLEILERLWWRLDRALGKESTYLSALVFYIAAIKAGTTTIFDHHASPNYIAGSLDTIAEAALKAGVRSSLCYEVTDRNGKEGALQGVAENTRFMERCLTENNPLLASAFGLHASFTVGDETLSRCVSDLQAVRARHPGAHVGFHVHVAEGQHDEDHSLKTWHKRTAARLRDAGVLGPDTIVGHGVYLDDDEIEILRQTQTTLVTNPESNMNNAVGVPRVLKMMEKGICVGLGTDGMTYDMLQEYKCNYLVHKLNSHDPRVGSCETFRMLMNNNARIASHFFGRPVGRLEAGCAADVILVDYKPPTPLSAGNLPWHLQFGVASADINTTIVAGRVLMRDRKLINGLDEADVMRQAKALAPSVWAAF
eukprot:TRINITY_DN17234_c0_g1_i1.p1 TRINITY_DN17234_c0_g1~~TRINITY_DN17234_c0_g1_i1.p1  ORF type:complete len:466 (-),score=142.95 TRINITY_DN17234_c0_g1_i1:61-1428(-)